MKRGISLILLLCYLCSRAFGQSPDELIAHAVLEMQKGNLMKAITHLDELLNLDSRNIKAYTFRGYAKNQAQDFVGAIADFSKIIELEPSNSDAYDKRGICKKNRGDYQGALEDYNKAIELDQNNASAYSNRGVLKYDFLNDPNGACEDWAISKSLGHEIAFQNSEGKCDDDIGAIETEKGVLLYFNEDDNFYTIDLQGTIDLSRFPLIAKDGKWFQFIGYAKESFSGKGDRLLLSFMNWELAHYERSFGTQLKRGHKILSVAGRQVNFWSFENPKVEARVDFTPVIKTYFADFEHNDWLFRFSHASPVGEDKAAMEFLTELIQNVRFYSQKIDLKKLENALRYRQNYYQE
jgi:tetratricopeptide (TPR) repeat protein